MLTTKNYYGNPNLLRKVRIRTIAENQNEEYNTVVQNSFTNEKELMELTDYNDNTNMNNGLNASW